MTPLEHTLTLPTFLAFGRNEVPLSKCVGSLVRLRINRSSAYTLPGGFKRMLNGQPALGISIGDWEFFLRTIHQHEGNRSLQLALESLRTLIECGRADTLPGLWKVWLTFEELAESMRQAGS